jgi:MoxR-like ATPase
MSIMIKQTPLSEQEMVAEAEKALADISRIRQGVGKVIFGQESVVERTLVALLAGGHALLVGVPGLAKTKLVETLGIVLGLDARRIQFTPDLMPSDIVGTNVFDLSTGRFTLRRGPILCSLLLADEINRASPKTQSALLEAMEEKQVSVEGRSHRLPQPFFVIATQNPLDQLGTYALPESQLDRFLMRISLGYPDRAAERELLRGNGRRDLLDSLLPLIDAEQLAQLQAQVLAVHASDALLNYVQDLIDATRSGRWFVQGLSPRAGIGLLRAAKAQALISGRDYVAPDDVQAILAQTVAHRLVPAIHAGRGALEQVRAMLDATPLA